MLRVRSYGLGPAALALLLMAPSDSGVEAQTSSASTSGACSPVAINTQGSVTNICILDAPAWLGRYQTLSAKFRTLEDCSPDAEKARQALALAQLDEASEVIGRLAARQVKPPTAQAGARVTVGPGKILLARTAGEVAAVLVGQGMQVKTGQAVVALRPIEEHMALAAAQTNLARHQALKVNAETEWAALRQRVTAGTAFQEQEEQKAKEVETYGLLVEQDKAAERRAKLALSNTVIHMPYCGKVDRVVVGVGDILGFCSTVLRVTPNGCGA